MNIEDINTKTGEAFGEAYIKSLRQELRVCKGQWPRLVELSKGKLTYSWLASFSSGRIKMPHFDKAAELGLYLGMRATITGCRHFNRFEP